MLASDFEALEAEVDALMDRAEVTQALERIWERVRRLNRYVEEQAPWQLAKDPEKAQQLDQTLATLAERLRTLTVLLSPYMPASTAKLLDALGPPGNSVVPLEPLFPKRA